MKPKTSKVLPLITLPVSLSHSLSSYNSLSGEIQDTASKSQTHYFLSHLLPYDPTVKTGKRLQDGLNEYLVLLTLTEHTMHAWQKGDLHLFDPLVGENACQIRAVKIASMLRNSMINSDSILKEIHHSKAQIHELQTSHFPNTSLGQLLKDKKIDIRITSDERFLIQSFALTKTKVVRPFFKTDKPLVENAYTDSKKIKEIGPVGTFFSEELVKKFRKILSADSTYYVQKLAIHLSPSDTLLSDQFLYVHHGLKCLPYYWMTRALMNHAQKENIPIALIAQQIAKDQGYKIIQTTEIYFQSTLKRYERINPSLLDSMGPALVLIGSTCRNYSELPTLETWTDEILEHCPVDLVLAYAAAHRQYPDESKDPLFQEISDAYYEYHKAKAEEWGCSLHNPSRFFLTHAFCNTLKNVRIS